MSMTIDGEDTMANNKNKMIASSAPNVESLAALSPSQHKVNPQPSLTESSVEGSTQHDKSGEQHHDENSEQQQQQQQSVKNLSLELQSLDWNALQSRFDRAMRERREEELQIIAQFEKLVASINIWAESSLEVEENRARKRLRTRVAYVQHSEDKLEEKKKHYLSVVSAFQSALALLKES